MRLPVDDTIYQVDGVWLGPPGKTLPWRVRYVDYGMGACLFLAFTIAERRAGVALGFWVVVWTLLATVGLTRLVGSVVDHDRPVRSVLAAFAHEVGAPKLQTKTTTHTFRPPKGSAMRSTTRTFDVRQRGTGWVIEDEDVLLASLTIQTGEYTEVWSAVEEKLALMGLTIKELLVAHDAHATHPIPPRRPWWRRFAQSGTGPGTIADRWEVRV